MVDLWRICTTLYLKGADTNTVLSSACLLYYVIQSVDSF